MKIMHKLTFITMFISLTMGSVYCMLTPNYQWQASTADDDYTVEDELVMESDTGNLETETQTQTKLDENGNTHLHILVSDWQDKSDAEKQYARQLIAEFPYIYVNRCNNNGHSPLHLATDSKDPEIIELLIRAGANVNKRDNKGNTPLFLACWSGSPETVGMLVNAGANVNIGNNNGKTPLHVTVWNDRKNILEILLRAGADFNMPDKNGNSPLADAINHNHPEILKYFQPDNHMYQD